MARAKLKGTASEIKITVMVKPGRLVINVGSKEIPVNSALVNAFEYKQSFLKQINRYGEFEHTDIIIDSYGGAIDSAYGLVDALYTLQGKGRILIDGQCRSAATLIPAGLKCPVYITERSSVYIHEPRAAATNRGGGFALWQKLAKRWDINMMVSFYRSRIKAPRKILRKWISEGRRFDAEEAVAVRFCDGIMKRYEFEKGPDN